MHANISQLETIVAIAEAGSYARASEALYVSAPALHQQVRALERACGCTLFRRVPRGVVPTAEGEAWLTAARACLDAVHAASVECDSIRERARTRLRVGVHAEAVGQLIMRTVARARETGAPFEVEITPIDGRLEDLGGILEGTYDCKECFRASVEGRAGLGFSEIYESPYRAVLTRGDPLDCGRAVTREELAGRRLAIHSREVSPLVTRWCSREPALPLEEVPLRLDAVMGFCMAGGVYVMTEQSVGMFAPLLAVPVEGMPCESIGFAHRNDAGPAMERFVELARDVARGSY